MAEIRLEDVSKVFKPGFTGPTRAGSKRMMGSVGAGDGLPDSGMSEEVRALDHLSLSVPDGTTTVIVGPSGCGKSTLLRAVAGLTDYEGTIAYGGRDMRGVSPGDRTIGMVFQSYALYRISADEAISASSFRSITRRMRRRRSASGSRRR